MSTDKTAYHEGQVLDRIFANVAPDGAQDGCYVHLWSSSPTDSPDSANALSGDNYSPVQVTSSGWSVTNTSSPRRYANDNAVDFAVLDSSSSKTVAGVVLYDGADPSTANALYADDLQGGSTTVNANDEFKIRAGNLTVEED